MKCVITGHTRGMGKYFFEHFTQLGWNIIGMSRENGYDINYNRDIVIRDSLDCDLFINNASNNEGQLELLKELCLKVPKMIIIGSSITNFLDDYFLQQILLRDDKMLKYMIDKKNLEDACNLISLSTNPKLAKILLIKLAFAETTYSLSKPNRIDSDYTIKYSEITNAIEFWLSNLKVRQIEFDIKLTQKTISELRQFEDFIKITGKTDDLINSINTLVGF
jgi:hypothetical protein